MDTRNAYEFSSDFIARGDQPAAIASLTASLGQAGTEQVLLGVTGSGKTFTAANVIANLGLPALVIAHNKTLAAQLYEELRQLFPKNAVEYFVSYYDYYQPEAYIPSTDTHIDKDSTINDAIDRLRHHATASLLTRNDVIIVASVSCIYGLGSAEAYYDMLVFLEVGASIDRDDLLRKLVEIRFERNDIDFHRGCFRVRGDVLEIFPAHEDETAIRIEWFGDEIDAITAVDPLRGAKVQDLDKIAIFPATHYAVDEASRGRALGTIREELTARLQILRRDDHLVEAQRLEQRTLFDLEMIEEMGYCTGIENYSRHLTGRATGIPPPTLVDYMPDEFLLIIDESHQTVPQIGAMYRGDRSRKETLVEHGFRLPSALDNRPLRFEEFRKLTDRVLYVSATPGNYELEQTMGEIVEQVIRPTGLLDPAVEVRPATSQVDDLLEEIGRCTAAGYRTLVTTLTKRFSEDLTEYLQSCGHKVRYLHSDIDTLERIEILRELRIGDFDVLVGINLLREGLDLPEVALVAILDADKEGFLRSERSLIQTIGRAARNADGRVILYADTITGSMRVAIDETERRRQKQNEHNEIHGITPTTVVKAVLDVNDTALRERREDDNNDKSSRGQKRRSQSLTLDDGALAPRPRDGSTVDDPESIPNLVKTLREQMLTAASDLRFEDAAALRDEIRDLERLHIAIG